MNTPKRLTGGHECCAPCGPCCAGAPPPCRLARFDSKPLQSDICGPRMCNIFGGHDTNQDPNASAAKSSKKQKSQKNSLGTPVGLVMSSFVINSSDMKSSDLQLHRFATYLKAFAKIYLTSEPEWDTATIDNLLTEGQLLVEQSKIEAPEEPEGDEVYSAAEMEIKRSFTMEDTHFGIELSEKFMPIEMNQDDGNGDVDGEGEGEDEEESDADLTLEYLRPALKAFFREFKFCLLKINKSYLLIWRARGVYFVLDFNGRRTNDFVSNGQSGVAMLICLRTLDNVIYLIKQLSDLDPAETYTLREIKMVEISTADGNTKNRDFGKRANEFEIINDDYAYVQAFFHLTLNPADPLRNRSALPVAVAAILASKIDHPATWNAKMLDKLICYGVNLCRDCWEECLYNKEPIDISRFPTQLKLGQFIVNYQLVPGRYDGLWKCIPSYKQSELTKALEQAIAAGHKYLIIQMEGQIYAVMKKQNFIYLFDPYRHRLENPDEKSGTLRMFRTTDVFYNVLNQIFLESNRTKRFFIHVVNIREIQPTERQDDDFNDYDLQNDDGEIMSLNENICFEDDQRRCLDELGEISDWEEDDTVSNVVRLEYEEKSESEEPEEMEEEEGGAEDIGEYESSSSGGGGGHRKGKKKRKKTRSERDKKGKGGKGAGGAGGAGRGSKTKGKGGKGKGKGKGGGDGGDGDGVGTGGGAGGGAGGGGTGGGADSGAGGGTGGGAGGGGAGGSGPGGGGTGSSGAGGGGAGGGGAGDGGAGSGGAGSGGAGPGGAGGGGSGPGGAGGGGTGPGGAENGGAGRGGAGSGGTGGGGPGGGGTGGGAAGNANDGAGRGSGAGARGGGKDGAGSDAGGGGRGEDGGTGSVVAANGEEHDRYASWQMVNENDDDKLYQTDENATDRFGDGDNRGRNLSELSKDQREEIPGNANLTCRPNHYPGYSQDARDMAVVGSETGSYESICKLLHAGFKCADRILCMTPWGNYVIFSGFTLCTKIYFLFDGCTCNLKRFRHLDLSCGTAGLLCFSTIHDVICYMLDSKSIRNSLKRHRKNIIDEICKTYC